MKRKFGGLVLSGLFLMISLLFTGCINSSKGLSYESDGQFRYHGGEKSYTIIGAEDNLPETVYVPSHYKGKEIVKYYSSYTVPSAHTIVPDNRHYWLYLDNVKRVYFPYNCDKTYFDWSDKIGSKSLIEQFYTSDDFGLQSFLNRANDLYFLSKPEIASLNFFVRETSYRKCVSEISEYLKDEYIAQFYDVQEEEYKLTMTKGYQDEQEYVRIFEFKLQIANTSYLFNYEGAPNDGYFFINEFGYGSKIENTPYQPIREGYTFGGWYKEAECKNEWNFDEDRLPQETHDETGSTEFIETKVYAKWIKK